MPDELKIHIYPGDCDSAGHVNHAVMLTLLERARWAALEKTLSFADYVGRAQWAVVRHVDASFSVPALPGDDFNIRTGLIATGNTSFTVKQIATNQRGQQVVEFKVVYVTLNTDKRPMPVPEQWRSIFPPFDETA